MSEQKRLQALHESVANTIRRGHEVLSSRSPGPPAETIAAQLTALPEQKFSFGNVNTRTFESNGYRSNPWDQKHLTKDSFSLLEQNMSYKSAYPIVQERKALRTQDEIIPITNNVLTTDPNPEALSEYRMSYDPRQVSPIKSFVDYSRPSPKQIKRAPYATDSVLLKNEGSILNYSSIDETLKRANRAIRESKALTQVESTDPTPISSTRRIVYETTNLTSNQQIYPAYTAPLPQTSVSNLLVTKALEVAVYSTKWKEIIEKGERDGLMFSDSEFLPTPASIGGQYPHAVEWLRPRYFFSSQPQMFVDGIVDPTSIEAGDLGNEYFRGAVSALTERDFSVLKLFQTKLVNRSGCYVLNICWQGIWTAVIIDDKFPVKINGKHQLCFSSSKPNELWMILLEKAWAKLHGSYAKIDGGLVREALHDLTGAPTRSFFIQGEGMISKLQLQERIQHAEDKDLVVIAQQSEDYLSYEQKQIAELYGISNKHPYTVLGTITASIQGKETRFVKLRNPQSKKDWPLDSVDKYIQSMSIEAIDELSYGGRCRDEGYFIMEYNHFHEFFSDIQICYQYEGFEYTGEKICCVRGQQYYLKVDIVTPGYYFFQLSQSSIRKEPIAEQQRMLERNYYSECYLAIASEHDPSSLLLAVSGKQRDLTSFAAIDNPVFLPQGEYLIFLQADWRSLQTSSGTLGLGIYGTSHVEIRVSSKSHCSRFAELFDAPQSLKWEHL